MEFLYWFRDNPGRPVQTDIEWAFVRFRNRFKREPSKILVHPKEEHLFSEIPFNIKCDPKISEGYIGVE